jgi:hypothetical protein
VGFGEERGSGPKADLSTGSGAVSAGFAPSAGDLTAPAMPRCSIDFRLSTSPIELLSDSVERRGGPMSLTYSLNLLAACAAFALVSAILIGAF